MAINNLKRALTTLNAHLASRTYLVGHVVTLADIILTCNLTVPFHLAATKEFTAEFPHLERYFWTLVNQPKFKKVLGDGFTQAAKPLGPPPPKGERIIPPSMQKEAKKVETAPKEKAAPAPKAAPAKPAESMEEEEEAPVKKTKNALDLLPPSPMVLDNWKRLYSNTKAKDFHLAISGDSYTQKLSLVNMFFSLNAAPQVHLCLKDRFVHLNILWLLKNARANYFYSGVSSLQCGKYDGVV